MGSFLLWSIIGSVVLTVVLNAALALWPERTGRTEPRHAEAANRSTGFRVVFPWKWMLLGSVVLTVLANVGACAVL